ncbi:unnamed protein product [Camellia sinensis]
MKKSMKGFTIPLFSLYSLFSIITTSKALDTITKTHFITYNNTIVSPSESFEMRFFTPGNSKNWYIAIWYKKIASGTIVWVANRDNPLPNSSGVLKLIDPGILILLNSTNNIVWSTNTSRSIRNPVARLLDSGNLIIQDPNDHNPENFLWQSFDYPCDTLLPGMKVGKNLVIGREWHMSSWKSKDDPAHGTSNPKKKGTHDTYPIQPNSPGDSQSRTQVRWILIPLSSLSNQTHPYWLDLCGYPQMFFNKGSVVLFRDGPWNGLLFTGTATILIKNPIFKFGMHFEKDEIYYRCDLLNSSVASRFILTPNGFLQRWTWINQNKGCDDVNKSLVCGCLSKFVPKNPKDWNTMNWSGGCVRRTVLDCENGDEILKYSGVKFLDMRSSWYNRTMTLGECREVCLKNCSCMAYSSLDIRGGGSGCLLWFDDLVVGIYIRMASSELVHQASFSGKKSEIRNKRKKKIEEEEEGFTVEDRRPVHNSKQGSTEKHQKDFAKITSSTNNFSIDNKLGEGGYGPIYKGKFDGGQEIAVKRLSKCSNQGLDEFKNEIIYEGGRTLMDWPKRFHIINGIARGLLYLHQDSRLRIIHRDLKASNILLDINMNLKISDFVATLLENHAWRLYEEGKLMELVDGFVRDSCCLSKVSRSIHVGLFCVQQHPEDRLTMSSVVIMLGSEGELPWPKQPGFFFIEFDGSSNKYAPCSTNELTITTMQPR